MILSNAADEQGEEGEESTIEEESNNPKYFKLITPGYFYL
jgi:hypothetical protein